MIIKRILVIMLPVLLVYSISSVSAQKQLEITYTNLPKGAEKTSKIELVATQFYSLSTSIMKTECTTYGDDETYFTVSEQIVFKDYKKNTLYYEEQFDQTLVSEQLNQFNWQVTHDIDTVLGYRCTKAITEYRGRKYTAWFTVDLPFQAAPWKFHGLPGVILKINSVDKKVKMEAMILKISKEKKKENPFENKKCISYKDYIDFYLKKNKSLRERVKAIAAKTGKFAIQTQAFRIEKINDPEAISVEEATLLFQNHNK